MLQPQPHYQDDPDEGTIMLGWVVVYSAVAIVLFLIAITAHAEGTYYGILGAGVSRLEASHQNGLWHQDGYGYQHAQDSNFWRLGVGKRLDPVLDVELDYRSLGHFNGEVRFVSDFNYNPHTHGCNGPCEATQTAMVRSDSQGLALSTVAHLDAFLPHVFVRGGAFFYSSKTFMYGVAGDDPHDRAMWKVSDRRSYLVTPFAGLGAGYKNVSIECDLYRKVGGRQAPMESARSCEVSFNLPF